MHLFVPRRGIMEIIAGRNKLVQKALYWFNTINADYCLETITEEIDFKRTWHYLMKNHYRCCLKGFECPSNQANAHRCRGSNAHHCLQFIYIKTICFARKRFNWIQINWLKCVLHDEPLELKKLNDLSKLIIGNALRRSISRRTTFFHLFNFTQEICNNNEWQYGHPPTCTLYYSPGFKTTHFPEFAYSYKLHL